MKTAVIAVAYNRVDSLSRLLRSLEEAVYPGPTTLIVSVDKSQTTAVEDFADAYIWPHGGYRVVKHERNLGLRAHMLSLGNHFDEFDALVVLEDDVTVAPSFFLYASACVERYHADDRIAGISLYSFAVNYHNFLPFQPLKGEGDVYLMNCAQSWGEVWMKRQWTRFRSWYDANSQPFSLPHLPSSLNEWSDSSWLKYHTRYCMEHDIYFVYPYFSLSTNNSARGEHNTEAADTLFQVPMQTGVVSEFRLPPADDINVRYDGFFQPKFLAPHLGLGADDLCVDVFSCKPDCLHRRYLLTERVLPYKVEKAFALQMRPVEMNVICHVEGGALFLYDTHSPAPATAAPDPYQRFYYLYGKAFYKVHKLVGLRRTASLMAEWMWSKVKSTLRLT